MDSQMSEALSQHIDSNAVLSEQGFQESIEDE